MRGPPQDGNATIPVWAGSNPRDNDYVKYMINTSVHPVSFIKLLPNFVFILTLL